MDKRIAILTSKKSWFIPYARQFTEILKLKGYKAELFFNHGKIKKIFQIVFILSYFNKIHKNFLKAHMHNLVIHESNLPKGRGWAPLFWQVLEGKNKIPIVLFEANENVDKGPIYLKDYIYLKGHELHDEIRKLQAKETIKLCLKFLRYYKKFPSVRQKGRVLYYRKRTPRDSKLEIEKSIKDQFNLLRVVNNRKFPAFFVYKGHRYILKIFKDT